ncbi:MAG: phosphoenolpyruvate--protein phosphotransferase [Myxococcales bacterium FL481]|nr:MAG: phosphoenolpyruvate--protein phosphotransferase [Myxococcales bacterium FL481]
MSHGSASGSMPAAKRGREKWRGIAASPGVGVGLAYVVDRGRVHVSRRDIDKSEIDGEIARFRAALKACLEELEGVKARLSHGEHRQILKAQQLMLRDPDLTQDVETRIRDAGHNAEWAVAEATDAIAATLDKVTDPYFRDRQYDVTFLGDRILRALQGDSAAAMAFPKGSIVVASDLSPGDVAALHSSGVAGIVAEIGGRTSHASIMARAFEIPAVVGIEGIIDGVRTGETMVVDAVHGLVISNPDEQEESSFRGEVQRYREFEARVQKEHGLLATTTDGTHVVLRANVALHEDLESAGYHGAEGVGLYRTEYLYMNRTQPPTEEEHYLLAKQVLARCAPYPAVFRTFDLGSDKPCTLFEHGHAEANPAMGLRSLRLALRESDHFAAQLRGLLRAGVHGPLRIMFPLVSGLAELQIALSMVEVAKRELSEGRIAHAADVPVGIMIEVPSAALMVDQLAQHVDFLSIGTNDLIQYTLAIDRENDEVNYLYQPLHPALLKLLGLVCDAGKRHGVAVSVCGEMAADPLFTWVLMGLGVRELSVHPAAIPVLKNLIRASALGDAIALTKRLASVATAPEAEAFVLAEMNQRFPEHLLHGAAAARGQ